MASKGIIVCRLWLVIFFSCLFVLSCSFNADTLNQGHVLSARDRLVSKNGHFTLGFSGSYLVTNYTAVDMEYLPHPVWLANRDDHVMENSGVLTLDNATGTLKIVHGSGKPIELYKGFESNANLAAILQDDGNFVVKEVISSGGQRRILWESFDHQKDTLMPGMKLGINHKTEKTSLLRSRLAEDNPKPGNFTLEWDPDKRQVILRRGKMIFWTSGVSNPGKGSQFLNRFNQNYNFKTVSNKEEEYFSYSIYVDEWTTGEKKDVSRWFLDYQGNIRDNGGRPVVVDSEDCDGNSTEFGCRRWESGPKCRRDGDKFAYRPGYFSSCLNIIRIFVSLIAKTCAGKPVYTLDSSPKMTIACCLM